MHCLLWGRFTRSLDFRGDTKGMMQLLTRRFCLCVMHLTAISVALFWGKYYACCAAPGFPMLVCCLHEKPGVYVCNIERYAQRIQPDNIGFSHGTMRQQFCLQSCVRQSGR